MMGDRLLIRLAMLRQTRLLFLIAVLPACDRPTPPVPAPTPAPVADRDDVARPMSTPAILDVLERLKVEPERKGSPAEYVGRWRLLDEKGQTVGYFTLDMDGIAIRAHALDSPGWWEVVGGEVRITYSDGWKDALVMKDSGVIERAYAPGVGWDEKPTHVRGAVKGDAPVKKKR